MKKLFVLIIAAAFMAMPAFARIPARVTDAFQSRYAGATNVEWKHGLSKYKANFTMGDYRYEAEFDRDGHWKESLKMMDENRLPRSVRNSLSRSKYGRWQVRSTYVQYQPNHKPQYHIAAAKGDFKKKHLVFNENGELING